jgi:hypothetical protein
VQYARTSQRRLTSVDPAIERALARGLEPEVVAEILGVPISAVLEALTVQGLSRTETPGGRRPQEIRR